MLARTRRILAIAVAVLLAAPATGWSQAPEAATNPAPAVAPGLRQWSGATGQFSLSARARVVATEAALADEAETFAADLRRITGQRLTVVTTPHPQRGDLVVDRDASGPAHAEGYLLAIDDQVTLRARNETGIARGLQTVLQLFSLDDRRVAIPRGTATDWPAADERGYMLDVGRKYYQPSYIEDQIRTAAWYKLNTIHLHLTEWNAFRLDSPRFPGLAADESYTKADIARFEQVARKYHVTILPEIDLPAHATRITDYWPDTVWDCSSMNAERGRNFTIDVTKQRSRDVVKQLLDEFIPWFDGPRFHIGTDEYPYKATQERCPELVRYAAENGYANTDDVMVGFIDYMNTIVRGHGKTAQAWGWWDAAGDPTAGPDKSIVVQAYGDDVFADGTAGARHFLDEGYDVVYADGNQLYVTPGLDLLPDNPGLYTDWPTIDHPKLRGYQLSRWSDERDEESDRYHDWYAHRAQQVLADRAWGGPRQASSLDYENVVDRIGPPPGVTSGYAAVTADAGKLSGTPYGSDPPFSPDNGYDKAVDGDPATFFDYSRADGGYAGLDLGQPSQVAKVRILPRGPSPSHLGRMTGGRIQGCADGPAAGCVDLATVPWQPPGFDWVQLAVDDPGSYRWLRYVSPDGGFGNVAEVEFYAAPRRDVSVVVDVPDPLRPLRTGTVRATVTNTGDRPVHGLAVSLTAVPVEGGEQLPVRTSRPGIPVLAAGESRTVTWSVEVPLDVAAGDYRLTASAGWHPARDPGSGFLRTTAGTTIRVPAALSAELRPARLAVPAGESRTTSLRVTNQAAVPVTVTWRSDPPDDSGVTVEPSHGAVRLPAGASRTWPLTVTAGERDPGVVELPVRIRGEHGAGHTDLAPLRLTVTDGTLHLDGTSLLTAAGSAWTDYDVGFRATPYQTAGGGQYAQAGWFFRATDQRNTYAWLIGNYPHPGATGGNLTKVVYRDGQAASVEVVPLPMAVEPGRTYRVRTSVRGSEIRTYVDDVLVDTTLDATWHSGRIGFRQDSGESATFDDVRVTAPDGTLLFADDFSGDLSGWEAP